MFLNDKCSWEIVLSKWDVWLKFPMVRYIFNFNFQMFNLFNCWYYKQCLEWAIFVHSKYDIFGILYKMSHTFRLQVSNCLYALFFMIKSLISKLTSSPYQILLCVEGIVHHTIFCANETYCFQIYKAWCLKKIKRKIS